MTEKKCQKCGKDNPPFFTHCVDCGAKLADEPRKALKIPGYLKTGLIVILFLVLVFLVIPPLVQHSSTIGQDFSGVISVNSAAGSRAIAEYPLNRPVGNNDLHITVISARNGQATFGANRFFIVTVSLKNVRTSGNIQISTHDFEVIDSKGTSYNPYGIGSQVMFDLTPSESRTAELNFVIPQPATVKKIRFTFPGTSALASGRDIVAFIV